MVRTRGQSPGGGGGPVTGTYTGDGAPVQAIVGVGFQPIFVIIYAHVDVHTWDWALKSDQDGLNATYYQPAFNRWNYGANQVISLDADGFTVPAGPPGQFNQPGIDYTYTAFR